MNQDCFELWNVLWRLLETSQNTHRSAKDELLPKITHITLLSFYSLVWPLGQLMPHKPPKDSLFCDPYGDLMLLHLQHNVLASLAQKPPN
jgi:hypothetical protein